MADARLSLLQGANQAAAAGKLGYPTVMLGQVNTREDQAVHQLEKAEAL